MVSCAGYHLGGTKPPSLAGVRTVSVPMFANGTQEPRAEALATTAVTDAIVRDGTYRLADRGSANLPRRFIHKQTKLRFAISHAR